MNQSEEFTDLMNISFALRILRNRKSGKYTTEEIVEANETCEAFNTLRICPICNSRIVSYSQYWSGGCFPCTQWLSDEKRKKVRGKIHLDYWQVQQVTLRNKLEDEGVKTIPDYICPSCNNELVVRVSSIGDEKFWGCSKFPACRYTDTFYEENFPELA